MNILGEKFFLLSCFNKHIIKDIIPQIQITWIQLISFKIRSPTEKEWDEKKYFLNSVRGTGACNRYALKIDQIEFYQLLGSDLFKFRGNPDTFTMICDHDTIIYGHGLFVISSVPGYLNGGTLWCPIKPVNAHTILYGQIVDFYYFPDN